jgi:choice-of-anchor B domain-containing protein
MKKIDAIVLVVLLVGSLGFAGVDLLQSEEPRDLKAEFAFSGADDVYSEVEPLLQEGSTVPCTAGFAGPYPCSNVDLLSVVPLAAMGGVAGNDSWGWTDPETGAEIAMMGTGLGTAFIDVTDPTAPQVLGTVGQSGGPTRGPTGVLWRDVKVNNNHAFIVSERGGGMQVVDLTQLRGLSANPSRQLEVKATYTGEGANRFHNIAINEDTDTAYLVGGNFRGGLHMVDISDPANPTFAGGFADDGYTHDVQCVIYEGPDADYTGRELCFAANEDTLTVVDVTDRANPVVVNRTGYDSAAYTHQGWLTPDQRFFVFNDELDESGNKVGNTTTYMIELEDLDAEYTSDDVQTYEHATKSVDHNLYIVGDLIFEANYNAGLRVLRYTPEGLRTGNLEEVGFFDVDPALDVNQYGGAWNVYPFFESGTILVSTLDEGLFTLRFNDPNPPQEDETKGRPDQTGRPDKSGKPEKPGKPERGGKKS